MSKPPLKQTGFTIVELLIVVVVIAILAAITIVAYNGIQARAQASRVQSDVASAGKKIEVYKVGTSTSSQYPVTLADAGLTDTTGMTYTVGSDNSYCLTKKNSSATYSMSSSQAAPFAGSCGEGSIAARYLLNGNANDASPGGANGTVSGITYGIGQNTQANSSGVFSGTGYVQLPASTLIPRPLSMSAWVYPTNFGSGEGIFVVAADPGARISITPSGGVYGTVSVAGGWYGLNGGVAVLNQWNHVVLTVSETAMKSYLNGVFASSTPLPATSLGGVNYNTSTPYVIGADNYSASPYHGLAIGRIDDVSFYNRILNDAEVTGVYAAGGQ